MPLCQSSSAIPQKSSQTGGSLLLVRPQGPFGQGVGAQDQLVFGIARTRRAWRTAGVSRVSGRRCPARSGRPATRPRSASGTSAPVRRRGRGTGNCRRWRGTRSGSRRSCPDSPASATRTHRSVENAPLGSLARCARPGRWCRSAAATSPLGVPASRRRPPDRGDRGTSATAASARIVGPGAGEQRRRHAVGDRGDAHLGVQRVGVLVGRRMFGVLRQAEDAGVESHRVCFASSMSQDPIQLAWMVNKIDSYNGTAQETTLFPAGRLLLARRVGRAAASPTFFSWWGSLRSTHPTIQLRAADRLQNAVHEGDRISPLMTMPRASAARVGRLGRQAARLPSNGLAHSHSLLEQRVVDLLGRAG